MTEIVLDASVALGWLIDAPGSAYAMHVQQLMVDGARALVPVHWPLEIANAVAMAARRHLLRREVGEVLAQITDLLPFIAVASPSDDIAGLVELCGQYGLTAYDAAYVALAARRRAALATQDRAMMAAAKRMGLETVA